MTSLDLAKLVARARHQSDVFAGNITHDAVAAAAFETLPSASDAYRFRCAACDEEVAVTGMKIATLDGDRIAAMQFHELVAMARRGEL